MSEEFESERKDQPVELNGSFNGQRLSQNSRKRGLSFQGFSPSTQRVKGLSISGEDRASARNPLGTPIQETIENQSSSTIELRRSRPRGGSVLSAAISVPQTPDYQEQPGEAIWSSNYYARNRLRANTVLSGGATMRKSNVFARPRPEEKLTTIIFDMPQHEVESDVFENEINPSTLTFKKAAIEREYASFFTTNSMRMWRVGLLVGLSVSMILFLYDGIATDRPIIDGTLLFGLTAIFPIVSLLCSSYILIMRQKQAAKFAHGAATFAIVLMGGMAVSARHFLLENDESPYKTGTFYLLLLLGAHVMLKIRYLYLIIIMPLLLVGHIVEEIASMRVSNMDYSEHIVISNVCLAAAMCMIASSSYTTEKANRREFLISRVSAETTGKLVEQLKRLQKTYSHQVADFDSPLEKSIILVKSILADPSLQQKHISSLSKLLALLKSGDLMTPDIEKQVQGGFVDLDKEQEVSFSLSD
ncbi:MAG: hypothetical protein SGCHY_002110 [Lobulomycetales sp.]